MIKVQNFETTAQAASALDKQSRYFAGGTLLMRQVNYGDQSFNTLVCSNDPEMKAIRKEGQFIRIGAGCTMNDLIQHSDLAFLAHAARSIGGPAIRNMATIGGNIFAPRPYGDLTTALLALNAKILWSDNREQSIEEFLQQGMLANGIVMAIMCMKPQSQTFKYLKVSRIKPKGVSMLSIASLIESEGGRIAKARVVFGGMGPVAMRASATESALIGQSMDEAGIQRALDVVCEGLLPEDDALASAWYRKSVAPVYLKRMLMQRSHY